MSNDRENNFFLNYTSAVFDIGKMIQIEKKEKGTLFNNSEKKKPVYLESTLI